MFQLDGRGTIIVAFCLVILLFSTFPLVMGQSGDLNSERRIVNVFNGQVQVPAGAQYHVSFDTTSNFTRARIAGNVQAAGGTGNDIRVLIVKDQSAVYDSRRRRTVVFSIDASERAHYTLYFDNRFSVLSPKVVSGRVSIVAWAVDSERNAADAKKDAAERTVASVIIQKLYTTLKADEQALGTNQLSGVPVIEIVKDRSPNASAGWTVDGSTGIRVTTGLFDLAGRYGNDGDTKATDVLANVLAHELSHIFYRHPGYGSSGQGVKGLFDELLGVTALDRVQEREADVLGIRVACQAGFNPNGMLTYMEAAAGTDAGVGSFMRNHPSALQRLNYLRIEATKCQNLQSEHRRTGAPNATAATTQEIPANSPNQKTVCISEGLLMPMSQDMDDSPALDRLYAGFLSYFNEYIENQSNKTIRFVHGTNCRSHEEGNAYVVSRSPNGAPKKYQITLNILRSPTPTEEATLYQATRDSVLSIWSYTFETDILTDEVAYAEGLKAGRTLATLLR